MTRRIILALPLLALAAPAFAEPSCKAVATPLPMWQVAKNFEEAGGQITNLKVTNGCYEIYGKSDGKKVELFFDPETGAQIKS
ncbi:MAG: PepSY domain-containing protein [Amaricoccus sp.]